MLHTKTVPILIGGEDGLTYFDSEGGVCTMSSRASDEYDSVWQGIAVHIDGSDLLRLYDPNIQDLAIEIVDEGIGDERDAQDLLRQRLILTSAAIRDDRSFEVSDVWDELPAIWKSIEPSEDAMQFDIFTYFDIYLEGLVDGIRSGSIGVV